MSSQAPKVTWRTFILRTTDRRARRPACRPGGLIPLLALPLIPETDVTRLLWGSAPLADKEGMAWMDATALTLWRDDSEGTHSCQAQKWSAQPCVAAHFSLIKMKQWQSLQLGVVPQSSGQHVHFISRRSWVRATVRTPGVYTRPRVCAVSAWEETPAFRDPVRKGRPHRSRGGSGGEENLKKKKNSSTGLWIRFNISEIILNKSVLWKPYNH